ncbi:MAG TPA: ACT domain-containing protein [Planctomycetota bacterium]|nr:ACT domain-containing protein [Planctomycetota bacterium]
MSAPISDRATLLRTMNPVLHEGAFVFVSVPAENDISGLEVVAAVLEDEGWSLVLRETDARARGFASRFRAAWITLTVASDLHAVGLTAAVAQALAAAGIACNVIAGAHHDHLFVPVEQSAQAMSALRALQASGGPPRKETPRGQ